MDTKIEEAEKSLDSKDEHPDSENYTVDEKDIKLSLDTSVVDSSEAWRYAKYGIEIIGTNKYHFHIFL